MKTSSSITSLLLITFLLGAEAQALTDGAKKLIDFETKANAVSTRSNEKIAIPHFEIPLAMLDIDFAESLPMSIRNQLVFTKNGVQYVRWILNPEDTIWSNKVKEHFATLSLQLEKQYYFTGYQTASRSYIVEDPAQSVQFSVKSSTNKTGGNWADKKQPVGEAIDSRLNSDFLKTIQAKLKFQNIIIMEEPAIIKAAAIDQAVVIRDLVDLNRADSGKMYVPGFSVLHEETGRQIAAMNGSSDPYAFWSEHYVKAVGRALGEFGARTGMQFDSPHSQNFLVELDAQFKPTGRIVFRDLADLYIDKNMMQILNPNANTYLEQFTQKGNVLDNIQAGFGPLHGNSAPSWISDAQYSKWKDVFFNEFESSFSKESGLKLEAFKYGDRYQNARYFGNGYVVKKENAEAAQFLKMMQKTQTPKGIVNCAYLFRG